MASKGKGMSIFLFDKSRKTKVVSLDEANKEEVIDKTGMDVFKMGEELDQAPENENTVKYVPIWAAEQQLRLISEKYQSKISDYKTFINQMKDSYITFEEEADKYYRDLSEDGRRRDKQALRRLAEEKENAVLAKNLQDDRVRDLESDISALRANE